MKVSKSLIVFAPLLVSLIVLVYMFYVMREMSVIAIGQTLSFLMCGTFFIIDKYWFRSIDTIALLKNNVKYYFFYMGLYVTLIIFSWLFAFMFNHF